MLKRWDRGVILDRLAWRESGAGFELSARARPANPELTERELWFRSSAPPSTQAVVDASPFFPSLLLWCMAHREPLIIDGEVSGRLLDTAPRTTALLRRFWPGQVEEVPIEAAPRALDPGPGDSLCLFTRGVDSWFSVRQLLAEHGPSGGHRLRLLYLPGRDLPPGSDAELVASTLEATQAAARSVGLELVTLQTNSYDDLPRALDWDHSHGAVLIGAGLALAPSRMVVPSTAVGDESFPLGSHPHLDPLFSTERTRVVHHGEVTRLEKVRALADYPKALESLRVCLRRSERNCGTCEKCLRTMLELHVAGALPRCSRFDRPLDPVAVARTSIKTSGGLHRRWERARGSLGASAEDRRLAAAVDVALLKTDLNIARERARALERSLAAAGRDDLDLARPVRRALRCAARALEPDARD